MAYNNTPKSFKPKPIHIFTPPLTFPPFFLLTIIIFVAFLITALLTSFDR